MLKGAWAPCAERHTAARSNAGAAGAAFRPVVPHAPWDPEDKKKTGNPGPDENTGDDERPDVARMERSEILG